MLCKTQCILNLLYPSSCCSHPHGTWMDDGPSATIPKPCLVPPGIGPSMDTLRTAFRRILDVPVHQVCAGHGGQTRSQAHETRQDHAVFFWIDSEDPTLQSVSSYELNCTTSTSTYSRLRFVVQSCELVMYTSHYSKSCLYS